MSEERYSELGTGVLSQVGGWLYWALVLELMLVVTALPGLLAVLFLDRSASNVPLLALCLVPLGPALSATVFAWHRWLSTPGALRDQQPARAFLRGYRLNGRDVLLWWVPMLVALALLGFNAVHAGAVFGDAGPGQVGVSTLAYVLLGVAVVVWAGNALVLTSLFSFRTRDVARLAAYYLGAKPMTGIGVLALVIIAVTIEWSIGDLLLVALASTMTYFLVRSSSAMVLQARARFTAPAGSAIRPAVPTEAAEQDDDGDR